MLYVRVYVNAVVFNIIFIRFFYYIYSINIIYNNNKYSINTRVLLIETVHFMQIYNII